ncbi:MAG: Ig-like domain-containing protein [Prevotellaceae bacterium]|nr:Ig-like domain-containing protein [Prevotellaceae bacterium]
MIIKQLKNIFILLALAFAVHALLLPVGCARIGSPTGGPTDSLPPILLKTQPGQGALFFNKKRVSVTFNEFIQFKETDKNFVMSPPPEKRPTLSVKGKSVVAIFNSPLKDSTTYQLNFGAAIVDNNEGNPYGSYRLSFSTGPEFDSMRVAGLVIDAYTDQPIATPMVYLYEDLSDSVVLKIRPENITRPNEYGDFFAENLKSKPYKIVVLDDANKNYKYDVGQEAIAFLDLPVQPVDTLPDYYYAPVDDTLHQHEYGEGTLVLRAFTEDVRAQYMTSCEQVEKRALKMTFNAPLPKIDSLYIDSLDVQKFVVEASPQQDTLIFWFADTAVRVPDTLNLSFTYLKTDTAGLSPSREKRKFILEEKKGVEKTEKVEKSSRLGGLLSRLTESEEVVDSVPAKPAHWTLQPQLKTSGVGPIQPVTVEFSSLLISENSQLIKFEEQRINPRNKDTTYAAVSYALKRDSIRLRKYVVAADWKENTTYRYTMLPNAFWDIYSQTNDTITGFFTTVDPDKLAVFVLNFTGVDSSAYLVQLTDANRKAVLREHRISADEKLEMKYLPISSYGIRVVKDDNANGKWDTGSYFKHVQPEYATFLKASDGKPEFALKQGWDMELSVDMKVLFPEK